MSRRVLLDTSGWLAALSSREARHQEVLQAYRTALEDGRVLVTTNLVVAEMHVLLTGYRGAEAALSFLDALKRDARHEVLFATPVVTERAVDRWLRPFGDHAFSLTDAVSFECMRRERISTALALGHHFSIAGYVRLPGS